MPNLTGQGIYQKTPKADKPKRKSMRQVSKNRAKQHASPQGKEDMAYMGRVRQRPCCICGSVVNVKSHHCKCIPPFSEQDIYERLPAAGMKSGPGDCIPLCDPGCHKDSGHGYHDNPTAWRKKHGPDYLHIKQTRKDCGRFLLNES